MIIVQGWVRLASEDIERLRIAASDMMRITRESEPGCIDYAFAQDLAEPERLHVVERWADEAALNAHFATPHMATFNQALASARVLGADIKVYAADEVRTIMSV